MAAWRELRAALVSLACWAPCSCSGETNGVPVPAFAAELPGETVAVVFEQGTTVEPALTSWLDDLVARTGLLAGPRTAAAWSCRVTGTTAGWDTLAASRLFRNALQRLPAGPGPAVFIDLQQLLDAELGHWVGGDARALALVDVLAIDSFEYAVVRISRDDDAAGYSLRGSIATVAAVAGLGSLLSAAPAAGPRLLRRDADDRQAVDLFLEPARAAVILQRLSGRAGPLGSIGSGVFGSLPSRVAKLLAGLWTGELALRVRRDGKLLLALGVVDEGAVRNLLGSWCGEAGQHGYDLPGGLRAQLGGGRLLVCRRDEITPPVRGVQWARVGLCAVLSTAGWHGELALVPAATTLNIQAQFSGDKLPPKGK